MGFVGADRRTRGRGSGANQTAAARGSRSAAVHAACGTAGPATRARAKAGRLGADDAARTRAALVRLTIGLAQVARREALAGSCGIAAAAADVRSRARVAIGVAARADTLAADSGVDVVAAAVFVRLAGGLEDCARRTAVDAARPSFAGARVAHVACRAVGVAPAPDPSSLAPATRAGDEEPAGRRRHRCASPSNHRPHVHDSLQLSCDRDSRTPFNSRRSQRCKTWNSSVGRSRKGRCSSRCHTPQSTRRPRSRPRRSCRSRMS